MSLRRLLLTSPLSTLLFARRGLFLKLILLLPLLLFFILITTNKLPNLDPPPHQNHPHNEPLIQQHNNNELGLGESNNEKELNVLAPPGDNPGENGKPYKPTNLTEAQKKLVGEGWKNNAFNQFVSDLISVKRNLPDPRDQWLVTIISN